VIVLQAGTIMVALLNRSTTTKRESNLRILGRSVMKSMVYRGPDCLRYWIWLQGYLGSWLILVVLTQGKPFENLWMNADIPATSNPEKPIHRSSIGQDVPVARLHGVFLTISRRRISSIRNIDVASMED